MLATIVYNDQTLLRSLLLLIFEQVFNEKTIVICAKNGK